MGAKKYVSPKFEAIRLILNDVLSVSQDLWQNDDFEEASYDYTN